MADLAPSKIIDGLGIVWDGGNFDSIELREPKMKELVVANAEFRNGQNSESIAKWQIALVCAVTGRPKQVIELMPVSKMNEATEYLQSFINAETSGSK